MVDGIDENQRNYWNQSSVERGLLDLSVVLSTRDITAGNQFAIFVLVKNPFDKPVWIRQVHVSLPSELKLANFLEKQSKNSKRKNETRKNLERLREEKRVRLEAKINLLNQEIKKVVKGLESSKSLEESDKNFLYKIESRLAEVKQELESLNEADEARIYIDGKAAVSNFKVVSRRPRIYIDNASAVSYLDVYDPESFQEVSAQARTVALESSLPRNTALQPGSTAVYTAVLYVEKSLIFTPSHYRLQFNVNYSFHSKKKGLLEETTSRGSYEEGEEGIFTNTVAHEISIRPSVYSVIIGAGLGGFTGSVARLLQITPIEKWQAFSNVDTFTSLIAVTVAVILSGIAVVFMARKSEAQSFVSVEDFWGGLLIGFLVGYTGTSFFEQLTGVTNPTIVNPTPRVSPLPQ